MHIIIEGDIDNLSKFYHKENKGWSKKQLKKEYSKEHPEWPDEECEQKANLTYKELNRLNKNMYINDKIFFEHNILFSFSSLLEEGYFEEFRKAEQYQQNFKNEVSEKAIKMIIKDLDKEEYEDV